MSGAAAAQPRRRPLAGRDPELAPIVDPNYLGDDLDMATMLKGFGIAREIGNAPALERGAPRRSLRLRRSRRGIAPRLHPRDDVVVLPAGGNLCGR